MLNNFRKVRLDKDMSQNQAEKAAHGTGKRPHLTAFLSLPMRCSGQGWGTAVGCSGSVEVVLRHDRCWRFVGIYLFHQGRKWGIPAGTTRASAIPGIKEFPTDSLPCRQRPGI